MTQGGNVSRPPDSRCAPVIKTEPVDDDEVLSSWASSSNPGMKAKETHLSSPIEISSEESDPPTLRAKPAKSNNSKPKASYVLSLLSVPPFCLISEVRSIPAVRDSGKTSAKSSRI